jgi:hypothetical protein
LLCVKSGYVVLKKLQKDGHTNKTFTIAYKMMHLIKRRECKGVQWEVPIRVPLFDLSLCCEHEHVYVVYQPEHL